MKDLTSDTLPDMHNSRIALQIYPGVAKANCTVKQTQLIRTIMVMVMMARVCTSLTLTPGGQLFHA